MRQDIAPGKDRKMTAQELRLAMDAHITSARMLMKNVDTDSDIETVAKMLSESYSVDGLTAKLICQSASTIKIITESYRINPSDMGDADALGVRFYNSLYGENRENFLFIPPDWKQTLACVCDRYLPGDEGGLIKGYYLGEAASIKACAESKDIKNSTATNKINKGMQKLRKPAASVILKYGLFLYRHIVEELCHGSYGPDLVADPAGVVRASIGMSRKREIDSGRKLLDFLGDFLAWQQMDFYALDLSVITNHRSPAVTRGVNALRQLAMDKDKNPPVLSAYASTSLLWGCARLNDRTLKLGFGSGKSQKQLKYTIERTAYESGLFDNTDVFQTAENIIMKAFNKNVRPDELYEMLKLHRQLRASPVMGLVI